MAFADLVTALDRTTRANLGGEPVIYRPETGESVTASGIFDDRYVAIIEGEAGVEQVGPAVFLRLEDLSTDPEVDNPILTIRGVDYRVRERQPDGMGGVRLLLQLVPGQ